ncbi:hypothetical protein KC340_g39 [Hortaea werneckii]|nr:hypothetical protein KC340_g39 [Hortaea werneckii]
MSANVTVSTSARRLNSTTDSWLPPVPSMRSWVFSLSSMSTFWHLNDFLRIEAVPLDKLLDLGLVVLRVNPKSLADLVLEAAVTQVKFNVENVTVVRLRSQSSMLLNRHNRSLRSQIGPKRRASAVRFLESQTLGSSDPAAELGHPPLQACRVVLFSGMQAAGDRSPVGVLRLLCCSGLDQGLLFHFVVLPVCNYGDVRFLDAVSCFDALLRASEISPDSSTLHQVIVSASSADIERRQLSRWCRHPRKSIASSRCSASIFATVQTTLEIDSRHDICVQCRADASIHDAGLVLNLTEDSDLLHARCESFNEFFFRERPIDARRVTMVLEALVFGAQLTVKGEHELLKLAFVCQALGSQVIFDSGKHRIVRALDRRSPKDIDDPGSLAPDCDAVVGVHCWVDRSKQSRQNLSPGLPSSRPRWTEMLQHASAGNDALRDMAPVQVEIRAEHVSKGNIPNALPCLRRDVQIEGLGRVAEELVGKGICNLLHERLGCEIRWARNGGETDVLSERQRSSAAGPVPSCVWRCISATATDQGCQEEL